MNLIKENNLKIPIKSWCEPIEDQALAQAINLANHPAVYKHIAIMPDCHVGYGMPIGGVIACIDAVIPNAVGVDIGCGMVAVKTDYEVKKLKNKEITVKILNYIKNIVPLGEGHSYKISQEWEGFNNYLKSIGLNDNTNNFNQKDVPSWLTDQGWELDKKNLGTLGGGNHFIELQEGDDGFIWLMIHSGSRNMGYRIASFYHKQAIDLNLKNKIKLADKNLSFLSLKSEIGKLYIRDMNFALSYANENRKKIMATFKNEVSEVLNDINFSDEINIHHNYANLEKHFNKDVWVHRKGATSAKKGEKGIIPGSMGSFSYIVEGLGNPESFTSCSHGAGRKMGRMDACRRLSIDECNRQMKDIVFDNFKKIKHKKENYYDLSEAPSAYKDIDRVIKAELDLIIPKVKLKPLGVLKG